MPWRRRECHQTELADMKSLFKKFLNSYEIQLHVLRRDLLTPSVDNIFSWNLEETIKREIIFLDVFWSNSRKTVFFTSAKRNSKEKNLILSIFIFNAVSIKLNLFQMVFSGSSHRVLFLMGQVEFSIYQCFTPIDAKFLEGLMQIQC